MKSVAIVYVSLHGQTRKIAKHLKGHFDSMGISSCLMNAEDSTSEEFDSDIDAVILGAPVYLSRYPSSLIEWIPRHKTFLESRPLAFFSVSMNAADPTEKARRTDDELLGKFIRKSGLRPQFVASFAGGLPYTDYNWFMRLIMKRKSAQAGGPIDTRRDYEFTDFRRVKAFADAFYHEDRNSEFFIDRHLNLGQPQAIVTPSGRPYLRPLSQEDHATPS